MSIKSIFGGIKESPRERTIVQIEPSLQANERRERLLKWTRRQQAKV